MLQCTNCVRNSMKSKNGFYFDKEDDITFPYISSEIITTFGKVK